MASLCGLIPELNKREEASSAFTALCFLVYCGQWPHNPAAAAAGALTAMLCCTPKLGTQINSRFLKWLSSDVFVMDRRKVSGVEGAELPAKKAAHCPEGVRKRMQIPTGVK